MCICTYIGLVCVRRDGVYVYVYRAGLCAEGWCV